MQTHLSTLSRFFLSRKILPALFAGAAFVFALWIRVQFFRSFPDPIPTPDTWGYLTGVFSLLDKSRFDLFVQRTPGFPIIVWITLAVSGSFAALNIVHGLLTLLSGFAVAYVARAFGGPFRLPAALAFAFVAVHPHILYWEHFLLSEGSFQAFFTLALCAIALAILRTTPRLAVCAGVLSAIAALIRPQGMLLTPMLLLALGWTGRRLGKRKLLQLLLAAVAGPLLLLGGWSVRNKVVHGFFGLSNVGPIIYFGISARWIELERPTLTEDKALIADSIRRWRSMPEDLSWVMYAPDGPGYLIDRKYANDPNRRDEVYSALAREAILHHPIAFATRGIRNTYKLMFRGERYPDGYSAVQHPIKFVANWYYWNPNWEKLAVEFPVDQYRAALDQTRFPITTRESAFDRYVLPIMGWETVFIRVSLILSLAAMLSLPWLRGPRRLVVALAAISAMLLVVSAGFLSEADQRYLSTIHGSAALAGALAMTGIIERLQSRWKF